jgi:NRPS condensation-like uncharacterized protein
MLWWFCVLLITIVLCVLIHHLIFKSNNNKTTSTHIDGVPLAPIELFYLKDYASARGKFNLVVPVEISFIVKDFDHDVFVSNLNHVLNAVQRKHPLLQASVVCENDTMDVIKDRWYFSWANKNAIPLKTMDTDDYEQVVRHEIHTNFPLQGPMIRATLCRGEKYYLVLTVFHLIIDGASFLNLVNEIIKMLGQMDHKDAVSKKNHDQIALMEKIETRPLPKSLLEQLDPKYHAGTLGNWIFFFKFLLMEIRNLGFKGITFPLSTGVKEQKSDFITFEVDKDTTGQIIKKSKEHKVSVTSTFSAACAFVASKYIQFGSPNQPIPVPLPVDLRNRVPSVSNTTEDIRALSTGIYTYLKVQDNVWDMAQSSHQQISQMIKSDFAIRSFQLYEILPKIVKSGDDQRCLLVSSFAPIQKVDSGDQFHSKIRGFYMSTHNTTNMVYVYLLTVEDKFIVNIWFNSSVQAEPVLQYAKSLEQYLGELGSAH